MSQSKSDFGPQALRLGRYFAIVLAALLGWPTATPAQSPSSGTRPTQWRLIWKGDAATTATVSWSTAEKGSRHLVRVRSGDDERSVASANDGAYTAGQGFYHHARLVDLKPSTRYDITIESDGQESPKFHFLTAPADNRPLKLIFGGDSRSGREARQGMNAMMRSLFETHPEILGLAHGGDFVASGPLWSGWDEWLTDHEATTAKDGRLLPIIPTRGNHDGGELFNNIFDFPTKDQNIYATSIGPQIRLLTLNTNVSTGGDQATWLERELETWRPKVHWLLAQYHAPVFPAVKAPSGGRRHWVPLFEKYNLDMACEADGHVIKRTPPIRDEKFDPTGVVYIGEGGLGVEQRTPLVDDPGRWFLRAPGKSGSGHHLQLLSFDEETLHYTAILMGGEVFDEATLQARKKSE